MTPAPLTRRAIARQAWPIMLGQITVPLVALVDTAIIGRTGDAAALAAVALGGFVVTFLFWAFGFLRMGMTGLTAQAHGAGDAREVRALLLRGVAAGLALGAALFALQIVLIPAAFALMSGSATLDHAARGFVAARLFGAPAALAGFAINGWLLALGRTRHALLLQVVMNLANVGLDILLVWHFGWGARGIAFGTASAEWVALATGLGIVTHLLGREGRTALRAEAAHAFESSALRRLFGVNADIMVRTVALLAMFGWLANAGARLGDVALAANHVLLQFVSFSAFVLDGFAFTAEARVGAAFGARDRTAMLRAIRLTGEFCAATGLAFALLILTCGGSLIDLLTSNAAVRAAALPLIAFAAVQPLIGAPAWLLDGVFIGATRGRALRNAAILATALYIAVDLALRPFGAAGVWIALTLSYVFRAGALGLWFPALLRDAKGPRSLAEPAVGP
ncbi:MATE family efflux transporter [Sphingomonas immobilis]|uniref:MATE family efflux transporter n=1 Tax=Sphingomonas immobilis TaxID=3063997 RepID=A0ABT8ZWW2_9SPHN|nr:MATE family efflux transporter [Sphingomonas sp. CA1-15]MDO7841520.1 MATE family efflux transporter [Sphingomonas sp. CA1-15]